MKTRRSVRKYTGDDVTEDDLKTIMECATQAPSPANWQPWKFIVVRDRELMKKMVNVVEEECDNVLGDDRVEKMKAGIERNRKYFAFFASAPVVIVATYRPGKFLIARAAEARGASEYDAARQEGFCVPMSVGASIQNLLLAAHALGYGACWMSGPLFGKERLEKILGVDEPWEIAAIIPIGKADEVPEPRERKLMSETVEYR
jgi:F420 biosynthesis protein FbiB-like protein